MNFTGITVLILNSCLVIVYHLLFVNCHFYKQIMADSELSNSEEVNTINGQENGSIPQIELIIKVRIYAS